MVLYQDLSVSINLVEDSNIVCVTWFEQAAFRMSDFEYTFFTLIENLERLKTEKLLVKTSKTMIHLPDEEYKSVIALLQSGLAHSRVKKVAKIWVDHSERDLRCKEYFREIMNEMQLKILFRNFDNREAALAWLTSDEV